MYCKTHQTASGALLACCDREILGKNLSDEKYDVTVDEYFYKGEIVNEQGLAELLKECMSINLFGKKAVGVALKQGFLTEKDIISIAGVWHAIIIKM